jgi:hypothetical protein
LSGLAGVPSRGVPRPAVWELLTLSVYRLVVMTEMDSTEGGRVHFSMRMLEDGAPAAVVLEHKTLGAPWKVRSTTSHTVLRCHNKRQEEGPGGGCGRHCCWLQPWRGVAELVEGAQRVAERREARE